MRIISRSLDPLCCLAVQVAVSAGVPGGEAFGADVDCPPFAARASREDCDGDLVPDICEMQIDSTVTYQLDDGFGESIFGMQAGVVVWLNQFRVLEHAEEIVAVDIVWGSVDDGKPATIVVWSDPNDDGLPEDALALQAVTTFVAKRESGLAVTVPVPPTFVGHAGRSFFVGCFMESDGFAAGDFPAAVDTTTPSQFRSWGTFSVAPPDLSLPLGPAFVLGFSAPDGNWIIRARTQVVPDCDGDGVLDDCEIVSGESADLDENGILDACEDCDSDGLPDGLEISRGDEQDCNGNGIPDSCELARQVAEDCNANGVPDSCEVAFAFSTGTGYLSPIGAGSPQSLAIADPPLPAGDVTINVQASGDFGFTSEFLTVILNGVTVGTLFQSDGDDCAIVGVPKVLTADLTVLHATWLAAVGDGAAVIVMEASPGVDPYLCHPSVISIAVSYLAAGASDLDLDGEVDGCVPFELADLDQDGDVDGFDLAMLLGQWTGAASYAPCPPHAPADLDGDCKINGFDLAILLGAWE